MGQIFIVTEGNSHLAGMARCRRPEIRLQGRIASAQDGQPPSERNQPVDRIGQQVHALLPRQTADHREKGAFAGRQAKAAFDGASCWRAGDQIVRVITRRQCCVRLRAPYFGIDAIEDAEKTADRDRIRPSSPMPKAGPGISCA